MRSGRVGKQHQDVSGASIWIVHAPRDRRTGEEAGFWDMPHLSSFIVKKSIALIKCPWDLFFYLEQIFYFSFFFKTFS